MPGRKMLSFGVSTLLVGLAAIGSSVADGGHGGAAHGGGSHGGAGSGGANRGMGGGPGPGNGRGFYGPGYYFFFGAAGADGFVYTSVPPVFAMGPFGLTPPFAPMNGPAAPVQRRGTLLPQPAQDWIGQGRGSNVRSVKNNASNPARSTQLMTLGDRLFRAGNWKKAEERYQQAVRSGPDRAAPYVRLAQLALVRGNYSEAADRFREAEAAQPGWLITAADIQPLFGEPSEFARQLGRIESHVQTHPQDRNAWLVLGAEWFLSGRTSKAADVFRRLDDPNRKPDVALAAFLDASSHDRRSPPPTPAE